MVTPPGDALVREWRDPARTIRRGIEACEDAVHQLRAALERTGVQRAQLVRVAGKRLYLVGIELERVGDAGEQAESNQATEGLRGAPQEGDAEGAGGEDREQP